MRRFSLLTLYHFYSAQFATSLYIALAPRDPPPVSDADQELLVV